MNEYIIKFQLLENKKKKTKKPSQKLKAENELSFKSLNAILSFLAIFVLNDEFFQIKACCCCFFKNAKTNSLRETKSIKINY